MIAVLDAKTCFPSVLSSGSRVCIGRNIAIMEVSKVVPTLLHKYKFSFTPRNTTTSPHKQSGRSVDGIESDSEPWHVVSHWVSLSQHAQHGFSC